MNPLDMRTVGDTEFLITWEDGHRSLYKIYELRTMCRCAQCIDEMTGKRILQPSSIPENLTSSGADPVGRYGVKFHFSDGHQTGIYSFDYLRSLCVCPQCREKLSDKDKKC